MTGADLIEISRARRFIDSAAAPIRRSAGLSLADVAGVLNVSPSTVLRWERGDRTPRAAHARAYAALLEQIAAAR